MEALMAKCFGESVAAKEAVGHSLTLVTLRDGRRVLCKATSNALIEGKMIAYLSDYLPCAELYYYDEAVVVMEYLDEGCRVDETEAARTVAQMHAHRFEQFGFPYDTTIGPHRQVNSLSSSWIDFFRQHRVMQMAEACYREGRFSAALLQRIERFAAVFADYLDEPDHPSLLHGDIWGGNVLCKGGRATYIDPAIYYGHHEMELAFITLFNTFSGRFFDAYSEIIPLDRGFFTARKDILNLYPLLVHVRSFGGSYVMQVESVLRRFGF